MSQFVGSFIFSKTRKIYFACYDGINFKGGIGLVLEELRHKFISCKTYEPMEHNELMDFARQLYLRGEITIGQFRNLIQELESKGAVPPNTFEDILEVT